MASQEQKHYKQSSPSALEDEPQSRPDLPVEKNSAQDNKPTSDFGPPPDGGLEAWSVVAGGFFAVFASFGWINCTFT
jgi:hypothetical protein